MIARWILSAILLLIVWTHAHWSVALVLTLMTINNEITSKLLKGITIGLAKGFKITK